MSTSFKVETLLSNLKDLQSEKNCLEQKLNKCREKRRQNECELERVAGKFMQVSDVHRKMVETLKVAQLKVTQTQGQTDSLEEANQKRRDKIAAINKTIETEKGKQQENVNAFEDLLADLTEKLVKARTYYKDDSLENELVSKKEKLEDITKTLSEKNKEVEMLTAALDQSKMHNHDTETEPVIPVDTCQLVWQMVKEENKAIHSYLEQLQRDLKGIHDTPQTQTVSRLA